MSETKEVDLKHALAYRIRGAVEQVKERLLAKGSPATVVVLHSKWKNVLLDRKVMLEMAIEYDDRMPQHQCFVTSGDWFEKLTKELALVDRRKEF